MRGLCEFNLILRAMKVLCEGPEAGKGLRCAFVKIHLLCRGLRSGSGVGQTGGYE